MPINEPTPQVLGRTSTGEARNNTNNAYNERMSRARNAQMAQRKTAPGEQQARTRMHTHGRRLRRALCHVQHL